MSIIRFALAIACVASFPSFAAAQQALIPSGSRVFVERMAGFEDDLTVALIGANVPVVIVKDRRDAEFVVAGRFYLERRSGRYSSDDSVATATLTIADTKTDVVVDAYSLSEDDTPKLARACAKRLQDKIAFPQNRLPAPSLEPTRMRPAPVQSLAPSPGAVRLFVQGDFNRLADFIETLRAELREVGIAAEVVQRGQQYDYNVVFVQSEADAAAVALDPDGVLVASAVDSGFRAKGVTEGCARRLARRMVPTGR